MSDDAAGAGQNPNSHLGSSRIHAKGALVWSNTQIVNLLLDAGTGWRSRDGGSLDDFRAFFGALPQR